MTRATNDQMVMHLHAQRLSGFDHLLRDGDIGARGRRVTRGVIVQHDYVGRTQIQRPAQHFAHVNRGLIDRSNPLPFVADKPVLGVEKQQVKPLHPAVTKVQAAVFEQGIKGRQQRFVCNLLRCQPPRGLAHHGNRGNGRLTDALDGDQRLRGCGEHVAEGTELRDQ